MSNVTISDCNISTAADTQSGRVQEKAKEIKKSVQTFCKHCFIYQLIFWRRKLGSFGKKRWRLSIMSCTKTCSNEEVQLWEHFTSWRHGQCLKKELFIKFGNWCLITACSRVINLFWITKQRYENVNTWI